MRIRPLNAYACLVPGLFCKRWRLPILGLLFLSFLISGLASSLNWKSPSWAQGSVQTPEQPSFKQPIPTPFFSNPYSPSQPRQPLENASAGNVPPVLHSSVSKIAHPAVFDGQWETNWGPMILHTEGRNLVGGTYLYQQGQLLGKLSENGKMVTGTWAQAPTYRSHFDTGRFVFTLSEDGQHFTGRWGFGDTLDSGDWLGVRQVH